MGAAGDKSADVAERVESHFGTDLPRICVLTVWYSLARIAHQLLTLVNGITNSLSCRQKLSWRLGDNNVVQICDSFSLGWRRTEPEAVRSLQDLQHPMHILLTWGRRWINSDHRDGPQPTSVCDKQTLVRLAQAAVMDWIATGLT